MVSVLYQSGLMHGRSSDRRNVHGRTEGRARANGAREAGESSAQHLWYFLCRVPHFCTVSSFPQCAMRERHVASVADWRAVGCSSVHFRSHALCGSSLPGIREAHEPLTFIPRGAPTHLATEAPVGVERTRQEPGGVSSRRGCVYIGCLGCCLQSGGCGAFRGRFPVEHWSEWVRKHFVQEYASGASENSENLEKISHSLYCCTLFGGMTLNNPNE